MGALASISGIAEGLARVESYDAPVRGAAWAAVLATGEKMVETCRQLCAKGTTLKLENSWTMEVDKAKLELLVGSDTAKTDHQPVARWNEFGTVKTGRTPAIVPASKIHSATLVSATEIAVRSAIEARSLAE